LPTIDLSHVGANELEPTRKITIRKGEGRRQARKQRARREEREVEKLKMIPAFLVSDISLLKLHLQLW